MMIRNLRWALLLAVVAVPLLAGCDALSGSSAEEYYRSAVEYRQQGDIDASVIELKNALQKDPDYRPARSMLGRLHLLAGNGAAAAKELKQALALGADRQELAPDLARAQLQQRQYQDVLDTLGDPDDYAAADRPQVLTLMGDAERALGRTQAGCARYDAALALDERSDAAVIGLASCDLSAQRFSAATDRLTGLLSDSPDNLDARLLLARTALARGDQPAAREALNGILERAPGHREARLMSAGLDLKDGDLAAAESRLTDLQGPRVDYLIGLLRYRQQRFADAEVALQRAINRAPGLDAAHLWLGIVHFSQQSYERARSDLREYLRRQPESIPGRAFLAAVSARLGEVGAVQGVFRSLAGVEVDDPAVLATLAQAALSVGAADQGRDYLKAAVARSPDNVDLRTALGVAFMRDGDASGAIDALGDAATMDGEGVRADLLLIRTLVSEKRFDEALDATDALIEKRPEATAPRILKGTVFLLQQKPEAARAQFDDVVARDPGSIGGHHGLALLALRDDRPEVAREHYRTILESHPDHVQTLLALYALDQREGNTEAAMQWLARAVEGNPTSALAAGIYGRQLIRAGRPKAAVEALGPAVEANPENAALLETWGVALTGSGDLRRAEEIFTRLSELQPDSIPVLGRLATLRQRTGDPEGARQALAAAFELDDSRADIARGLVQLDVAANDFQRADRVIERLAESDPVAAALLKGDLLLRQQQPEEAAALLRRTLAEHPDDNRLTPALARLLWAQGKPDAAIDQLEQRLASHAGDSNARRLLGEMYSRQGRTEAAAAAYQALLEQNPDDAVVLNNLALLRWQDDPEAALALARKANTLRPETPAIQDTLGWMLVQRGEAAEGLKLLEQAREQLPQEPSIRYHYATALAETGRPDDARKELDALLERFPEADDAEAARALRGRL